MNTPDQKATAYSLRSLADIAERDGVEAMQAVSNALQAISAMRDKNEDALNMALQIIRQCDNLK